MVLELLHQIGVKVLPAERIMWKLIRLLGTSGGRVGLKGCGAVGWRTSEDSIWGPGKDREGILGIGSSRSKGGVVACFLSWFLERELKWCNPSSMKHRWWGQPPDRKTHRTLTLL